MPEDLVIGTARSADIDAVHSIEEESFPCPWRREFFSSELGASGRFNRVARRGGRVIGYLFAIWILDELHVNKIAVTPAERRRGVADALMADCFAFSRTRGITSITLEVRRSNEGAQAFYRRLGFASAYVRRRYYPDGEDAVVMTCSLAAQ